jgi:hypothetical protein
MAKEWDSVGSSVKLFAVARSPGLVTGAVVAGTGRISTIAVCAVALDAVVSSIVTSGWRIYRLGIWNRRLYNAKFTEASQRTYTHCPLFRNSIYLVVRKPIHRCVTAAILRVERECRPFIFQCVVDPSRKKGPDGDDVEG